jgi:hypothetical protein
MTDQVSDKLQATIKDTVALIRRYQDRGLGEQNTKGSLIEPVLEALGWAVRDPDEVHREFKPTAKDNPVDYSLTLLRKPRLFVEAKGLGETLADRKWIAQVLGYAIVAGVEWCVLSDGDEYRFYNATAPVDADEKLFHRIRLTELSAEQAAKTLSLISRSNMEGNILDAMWSAHYVDRRVKLALEEMLRGTDRAVVRLIRRKVPRLTPREIVDSLRRLDVRIDSPTPVPDDTAPAKAPTSQKRKKADQLQRKKSKAYYSVNLLDIIGAGLLTVPLALFCKYRGTKLQATLLPDGKVEFQGATYDSCSLAADLARGTITGRRMNTNGWIFWQYIGPDGKVNVLADARKRFLAMKSQGQDPSAG